MFYNTKISTSVGMLIIILVATLIGWLIIKEYSMVMRFRVIDIETVGKI